MNNMKRKIKEQLDDFFLDFTDEFKKGFLIAVTGLLLFGVGNALGSLSNVSFSEEEQVAVVQQSENETYTDASTTAVAETTQASVTQTAPATTVPSTNSTTTVTSSVAATTAAVTSTGAPTSPAEIIALFNESANKIKGEATKVVKNFEKRTHNEDKLIIHSSIQGMANSLMEENFKDDTEPIEYATKEDIVANYQVPGETWVSQLTEAEVAEAVCIDNGAEYEITLKLHPTQNPENGVGVSKGVDTITTSEIMAKAPSMVKGFNTEYYDCVIKCKIDKATGRTIWSSYTTPVVLKLQLDIPIVGDFEAQVGMTFEKDYTITY